MEDNSILVVPQDWEYWNVRISRLIVKQNAQIIAVGALGADNLTNAPDGKGRGKCERKGQIGNMGGPAPRGSDGGDAPNITMQVGIQSIGSQVIDTSGGAGGYSGIAGRGGPGGRGSCNNRCNGMKGGTGGAGAVANGGHAGQVEFHYWFLNEEQPLRVEFITDGGLAGPVSPGGPGGRGGARKSCWPTRDRAAGKPGDVGATPTPISRDRVRPIIVRYDEPTPGSFDAGSPFLPDYPPTEN